MRCLKVCKVSPHCRATELESTQSTTLLKTPAADKRLFQSPRAMISPFFEGLLFEAAAEASCSPTES